VERRDFLRGVVGGAAVSIAPNLSSKDFESLLLPEKDIVLPAKVENVVFFGDAAPPPFGVTGWSLDKPAKDKPEFLRIDGHAERETLALLETGGEFKWLLPMFSVSTNSRYDVIMHGIVRDILITNHSGFISSVSLTAAVLSVSDME